MTSPDEPIVIRADSVAGRLMPAFLDRRVDDLLTIEAELARKGFRVIERIGHNLKGVGRSYDLDGISDIGAALETAAREHHAAEIRTQASALVDYLRRVRVVAA